MKSYCTHFLYCIAQLSWLNFTALFRPLYCVPLSLPILYESKWHEFKKKIYIYKPVEIKLIAWWTIRFYFFNYFVLLKIKWLYVGRPWSCVPVDRPYLNSMTALNTFPSSMVSSFVILAGCWSQSLKSVAVLFCS